MSQTTAPAQTQPIAAQDEADGFRFKLWEIFLLVLFAGIFSASLYVYVTDFPLIRKYVFGMQDSGSAVEVGVLTTSSGRIRRQKASQSEFQNIDQGAVLFNQDTIVTGPEVKAVITLKEGGRIELGPSTMVKLAFDAGLSLGGITRQANVQLVAGAVSGEAQGQKIVVTTSTGKKTSFGESKSTPIVEEAPAVPTKIDLPVSAVPLAMGGGNTSIPAVPIAAPAPPQPPPTVAKALPVGVSDLMPSAGEVLALAPKAPLPEREIKLAWKTSTPTARLKLRLSLIEADGDKDEVLEQEVSAQGGVAQATALLKRPGDYEIELYDPEVKETVRRSRFRLRPDFEGIDTLPPLVAGSEIQDNRIKDKLIKDFGGVTLRWKPYAAAKQYTVKIYREPQALKPLLERVVDEPQYTFNKNKVYNGRIYYRIFASLKSGFVASSKTDSFQFVFLPPQLVLPANGASVSSKPASTGTPASVLFTWQKTHFTEFYQLEVATDEGFGRTILTKKLRENFLAIPTPEVGTYFWRVRSLSQGAASQPSPANTLIVQ